MSVASTLNATPATHKRQLISWLETGGKPKDRWRIGTEHEKFVYDFRSEAPAPYHGERSISALLTGLEAFGWTPIFEQDNIIGGKRTDEVISLEPGGQLELSGAPVATLHDTAAELKRHLEEVSKVGRDVGLACFGMGTHPMETELPWMPKGRYRIMRDYMPDVGTLGLEMMQRTCTVQVNLDYADERDMVLKFRVSLALQPIITALFAASPFKYGKPTGDASARTRIWQDTDKQRYNALDLVFDEAFGFEMYTDWALTVPMYFIYRDGFYMDATGNFFRDFMRSELEDFPGQQATLSDWNDHLTTLFPPVRLKRYLEMRGADMGCTPEMTLALPAIWTGLLYDSAVLDQADQLLSEWEHDDYLALFEAAPSLRLDTPHKGRTIGAIAQDVVKLAEKGLKARGLGEEIYLAPLQQILRRGVTQADDLLRLYYDEWDQDCRKALKTCVLT
jgi:glutamate--cysteine ligase